MNKSSKLTITRRKLTDEEIGILVEETRKSPHIGLITPNVWKQLPVMYAAEIDNKLLGVCVVVPLKSWIKIGPVVVLNQHQKQGVGSLLLKRVNKDYLTKNLYIGSSNVGIKKIVIRLGFEPVGFWKLPREVKRYLMSYFWQRGSIDYLLDALFKRLKFRRGPYNFFVSTC